MIHPIKFLRWSREAGWGDASYVLSYPFRTWRCRLFGHDWGPEKSDYDPNVGVRTESWRDCQRPRCAGWWETFNVYGPAKGKMG